MPESTTQSLHLRAVRDLFSTLPPLSPDTVDIMLRNYLHIPEELMPQARKLVQTLQQHKEAA